MLGLPLKSNLFAKNKIYNMIQLIGILNAKYTNSTVD